MRGESQHDSALVETSSQIMLGACVQDKSGPLSTNCVINPRAEGYTCSSQFVCVCVCLSVCVCVCVLLHNLSNYMIFLLLLHLLQSVRCPNSDKSVKMQNKDLGLN